MKKATALGLAVFLTLVSTACAPSTGIKSGAAAGEALIKLFPKSTMGVVAVDVARAMGTEMATKALQDPKAKAKYDEFVKMSGIDPMKDVSYFGFGLTGMPSGPAGPAPEGDGGFIITVKYDKAKLLALMKEKAPEVREEAYNGVVVYSNLDGGKEQTTRAAFLDATHIAFGSDKGLKGIIDVYQKKADSLAKNAEMAAILKKVDKSGLAWAAFAIPPDLVKKGIETTPQLKALEGVSALTMAFDYKLATFTADIRALGGTKEQNANLASTLNGFKGLGAMFAAQEPVAGDVFNGIEIGSGQDYTSLRISLSQEVMDKLRKFAQSKAGDLIKVKKDEPQEEIRKP